MLKKLISLMVVFSIFIVSANAQTQTGLKAAFDELNYSLTVEWDQKDQDFYSAQMKKFSATLKDLQAKGLTNSQLVDFVKSEVKNEKVAKDLETAFNMIQINKMSSEDASKYMVDTMKKSYNVGASYRGEVFIYVAAFVLIAGVVAAGIALGGNRSSCVYVYECYAVYDYWGYYLYDDCGYTCY